MKTLIALAAALLVLVPAFGEIQINDKVPLTMSVFIPCAGETVVLTGELHTVMSITENENGIHVRSHFQPMGVSGVGPISGNKYQATGVTRQDMNTASDGFPVTQTFVNNFRIIGQGPGNNYLVHAVFHVTVNANGEVTAQVDNSSTECK